MSCPATILLDPPAIVGQHAPEAWRVRSQGGAKARRGKRCVARDGNAAWREEAMRRAARRQRCVAREGNAAWREEATLRGVRRRSITSEVLMR